jgi:hypothetical protein
MDPDDVRALDRARKLLALAGSPNVHEAASAAAMAQALIDRHRLYALLDPAKGAPARDPIEDAREQPLDRARKIRPWKVLLALTLAERNGCMAYTLEGAEGASLVLVGRAADRAAVEALWAWLVPRIEWLSATHGAGRSRRWHDDFRVGAVTAIAERLRASGPDPVQVEDGEGPATMDLAVIDRAMEARRVALDEFVRRNLRLAPGRAIRVDPRAHDRGRDRAAEADWLPAPGASPRIEPSTPSRRARR